MSVFPSTSNWVTLACLSVFCGQSGALIYVTQDRFHAFAVHDSTSLCILSHQSPSAALFPPPVLRAVCPYLLPCSLLLSRKNETNVSPHSVTVQILAKPFHAVTWKQLASVCNQQTEKGGGAHTEMGCWKYREVSSHKNQGGGWWKNERFYQICISNQRAVDLQIKEML